MKYTLAALALAAVLGGGVVWASVTDAPWEAEADPIIIREEVQPDGPSCDALYLALAQAPTVGLSAGMSEQGKAIQDAIRRNGC